MRLDKFVSHTSGASRVDSRRLIKSKRVAVNGVIIKSAAFSLSADDSVTLDAQPLAISGPQYFMLHKPSGYVCATTDSDHPTVLDLIDENSEKLSIAGRLDKDTTGLILLSDDGQWIHNIISPRRACSKMYIATLDAAITPDVVRQFESGITLRNETKPTLPASLKNIDGRTVEVSIVEGKYHQVKRMFAACGLHVVSLHRLQVGAIKLDETLSPGEYRRLTETEIAGVCL